LASYPKSGNTWIRVFLQHLLQDSQEQKGIPILQDIPIASNRNLFDRYLGVNSADLSPEEILNHRPAIYRALSGESEDLQFFKVHDAFENTALGEPIFPPEITRAVIYIVRNPLDLVVSYAFHSGKSFQTVIKQLNDPDFKISVNMNELKPQVDQHLGTWSQHVLSWTAQKFFPVILILYENLLKESPRILREMLTELGITFSEDKFTAALQASDFSKLKEQEQEYGFKEKPIQAASFFREGKKDIYRSYLSKEQISGILKNNREIMHTFGYLPDFE